MDANSALKTTEDYNDEAEAISPNKVDLNFPKSEEVNFCINEGYSSLSVPSDIANDGEHSASEPNLVHFSSPTPESEDNGKETFDYNYERAEIPITDYDNLEPNYDKNELNHSPKDHNDSAMNGTRDEVSIEPQLERIKVNDEMVWENSPRETQNASLSPERRLSLSAERSPSPYSRRPSPTSSKKETPFAEKSYLKSTPSPQSIRKKPSLSQDRLSPSKRQKSSSERALKRDFRDRDDSPRRRFSRSPYGHDFPRRRERSASRSPARRRASPSRQRDHRRSRSRSPIARNRNRRSPRRPSRRHRSPVYHSRQRSSRRPWSPPTNRSTGAGRPGKNLFIAGFGYGTTEKDLEKKFSKFGRITNVRIVRDKWSGDSRGFGFLSMERDDDADAAIRAVDQTQWNGRVVLVEKSKTFIR